MCPFQVLFPNIAPYDALSAVVTLGADHFLPACAPVAGCRFAKGVRGMRIAVH